MPPRNRVELDVSRVAEHFGAVEERGKGSIFGHDIVPGGEGAVWLEGACNLGGERLGIGEMVCDDTAGGRVEGVIREGRVLGVSDDARDGVLVSRGSDRLRGDVGRDDRRDIGIGYHAHGVASPDRHAERAGRATALRHKRLAVCAETTNLTAEVRLGGTPELGGGSAFLVTHNVGSAQVGEKGA